MQSRYLAGMTHFGPNGPLLTAPFGPERADGVHRAHTRMSKPGEMVPMIPEQELALIRARRMTSYILKVSPDDITRRLRGQRDPFSWDDAAAQMSGAILGMVRSASNIQRAHPTLYGDIEHAAIAGAAETAAYLEVIPHVLARRALADPRAELDRTARRSKVVMTHAAGLDDTADKRLMNTLDNHRAKDGRYHEYSSLRFSPEWFEVLAGTGVVGIPERLYESLESEAGWHVEAHASDDDIAFGCPARDLISGIYYNLLEYAGRSDLMVRTYESARRQLCEK